MSFGIWMTLEEIKEMKREYFHSGLVYGGAREGLRDRCLVVAASGQELLTLRADPWGVAQTMGPDRLRWLER